MSTMPERVWLYRAEYDGWDAYDKLDERFDYVGPYVPEQRAMDAEEERDMWQRQNLRLEETVTALHADLKALAGYAEPWLDHMTEELAQEGLAPSEAMLKARAILNREGM